MIWQEVKQLYGEGLLDYFDSLYNYLDTFVLTFYVISFTLRYVVIVKVRAHTEFFLFLFFAIAEKLGPPCLGKATTVARAALPKPSPTGACWVFPCFRNPHNSEMYYRILDVRT